MGVSRTGHAGVCMCGGEGLCVVVCYMCVWWCVLCGCMWLCVCTRKLRGGGLAEPGGGVGRCGWGVARAAVAWVGG